MRSRPKRSAVSRSGSFTPRMKLPLLQYRYSGISPEYGLWWVTFAKSAFVNISQPLKKKQSKNFWRRRKFCRSWFFWKGNKSVVENSYKSAKMRVKSDWNTVECLKWSLSWSFSSFWEVHRQGSKKNFHALQFCDWITIFSFFFRSFINKLNTFAFFHFLDTILPNHFGCYQL